MKGIPQANARETQLIALPPMLERFPLLAGDIELLRTELLIIDQSLQPDVSNYAPGRLRAWIQMEWSLKERDFVRAYQTSGAFWQRCSSLCYDTASFYPDLGLIAKGDRGIALHRDDSYAAFKAVSIQLGKANWTYDHRYPHYEWVPEERLLPSDPQTIAVEDEIIVFNCKNRHAASPLEADRYSINLWQVAPKYRTHFQSRI